jgi:hypothetical protein
MKILATKMALTTSVALAAPFSTEAAYARRYRAAPKSYDAVHSRPRDSRFTGEEQRIIDAITSGK